MTTPDLADQISIDLERLCSPPGRHPGTAGNRAATDYVASRLRELGLDVEELPFEVPEWRHGTALVRVGDVEFPAHPGPFSAGIIGAGPLVIARSAEELAVLDTAGSVLVLLGALAAEPLTPRGYPFYANPEHAALLDTLEATGALAIVAATTRHPMAGALSPFPLIEECGFALPSAYVSAEAGERLAALVGATAEVAIDSETRPSSGVQLIGRLALPPAPEMPTVVASAHIDSKSGTPAALDNAGGVAVLLAVAALLRNRPPACAVEFVPFNGEDHTLAPGELAYLAHRPDLSAVSLNVNIDGAGLRGTQSAYSTYGADEQTFELLARLADASPGITEGPAWPASDHMVFAMSGVPAIAITSSDFEAMSSTYSHTPADTPENVDIDLLAETARFAAALITQRWP